MEKRKPLTRKIKEGVVIANKMSKTVTVRVDRTIRHPEFDKVIARGKKYYAHTDQDDVAVGAKSALWKRDPSLS